MKHFWILLILTFCLFKTAIAQSNNDSLYQTFQNESLPDTIRVAALSTLTWNYMYFNADSALYFAKEGLSFANEKNLKKWSAKALNAIGNAYNKKGDYPKAMDYFQKSLKIREEIKDIRGQASTLANMGVVNMYLRNYQKALDYYFKSLALSTVSGNKEEEALALSNIGIVYEHQKDYKGALGVHFKALKIYEAIENNDRIANTIVSIGKVYFALSDYNQAQQYYLKALKIFEETNNKWAQALCMTGLGELYAKQKLNDKAIIEYRNAFKLAKEVGDLDTQMGINFLMYEAHKAIGKDASALQYYEQYIILRDSIYSSQKQNEITQKEMNYEFEKKEAAAKAEQDKKDAIAKEEKQKQKIILLSFIAGFLMLIVFSVFIVNRYRISQKQKQIIEKQKDLIEEHQKSVIESITYAKRIQEAILPPIDLIRGLLPNSFVLYKPKDIVAGDFYWMEHFGNTTLIAAADCTGHGVPGAMVSVVCSNALNRAVKEFHLTDPGKILDKVLDLVLETFEKGTSEVNDGMDISLLAINKATNQIKWSGANSPLWFFENGTFTEIKADKQPIGKSINRNPFTTHAFGYKAGTVFYLFTDGYADQFGGPKGKKLREKYFQEILTSIHSQEPNKQLDELTHTFEKWQGNLEQVDDVCVIGIRI